MMMTDWIRCRRSFELVKCRWIWNALQPITWPGNTWCTITAPPRDVRRYNRMQHNGNSRRHCTWNLFRISCCANAAPWLQFPAGKYIAPSIALKIYIARWSNALEEVFNLRSITCQTFFFITWQSFSWNTLFEKPLLCLVTRFMILLKKVATD